MALPQDDLEWVKALAYLHDTEIEELENLNLYYEGNQPLTYMHPELLKELEDRIQAVVIGWPQLAVDSVEERLDVEGFRLPDEEQADDGMWKVWQANDFDEQSQMGHVDALVMRRYYVSVGTNEEDDDTPLITAESPLEMFAYRDPRTRKDAAALKRTTREGTFSRVPERTATLYLPNRTVWFSMNKGNWVVEDVDNHNLGVTPVVSVINRGRLTSATRSSAQQARYGRSELAPIIPLSNAANKQATDMMVAAEFAALPLRGFWGLSPDDMLDEEGNKATAMQAIMGRFLTLANPEGKEFQFAPADLSNFHKSIESLAQLVASIAGLPPHYLGISTENPASADAIRSAESRLVKRAERKQRAFGGSYEQVMRLVKRFQEGDWDPRLRQLETVWRDASTPTVAQAADAAVKKRADRIISRRQAQEDSGYTAAQIKRMTAELEEEEQQDPVGQIARGFAEGKGIDDRPQPGT